MVEPPIAVTDGAWRYAAVCFLVALVASVVAAPVAPLALGAGIAVLWFHRDPPRQPPTTGIVAPADGRVSVIREEGDRVRVGVFMNVTDVHVNRAPAGGTVQSVEHRPGANKPAFSKDSDRNERVRIELEEHTVVLIAGWFARRIHPAVETGDELRRGQRIGHISFGSRADVVLPAAYDLDDLRVDTGDAVSAGETQLIGNGE
ncbi:MAG: phosphatidylserine decarboxylase [Halonotius sp. J07HN6]|jgi:Phosphatidylserine decarboxylase|nr:MAG: phosphatidylserine decarboxylase [Halonotius sp. J07HN6]